jgi:hypothetical protein
VHVIDGVTYVEVERKAEVGEKIVIVSGESHLIVTDNREIFTVTSFG